MKLIIAMATVLMFTAQANATLAADDDCKVTVTELANGLANSYKQYNGKPAKILEVKLDSATEVRDYQVTTDSGCIDTYTIELSNDSASKCTINKIESAGVCN